MFVIQTENGQILTDMGKVIYEDVLFEKWMHPDTVVNPLYPELSLNYKLQEDTTPILPSDIPVGSIEWTAAVSGISMVPDNLPQYCRGQEFAPRGGIEELTRTELLRRLETQPDSPVFVKSASKMKAWGACVVTNKNAALIPDDTLYFCTNVTDFTEEWRVFVFNGNICDVRRYLGNWDAELQVDDCEKLQKWVQSINCPYPAYTLDVGRTKKGLEVIELHQFISCGLYGFSDLSMIRRMAVQAWRYIQKKQKEAAG